MAEVVKLLPREPGTPEGADFAVTVTGSELLPLLKKGDTAYFERRAAFHDGDIGLFLAGGKTVIRQYAEDSEGNIYLFAVNRRLRRLDITVPAGSGKVYAFGRALLPPIPLPDR